MKFYRFKPPKPRRTSTTNLQIRKTFEEESSKLPAQISKFIGIKLKSLQKPHKPQISEALRIQASKTPNNFHHQPSKRKNERRTQRTHKEREEQRISKQAHSQRFIIILFQRSSIHSSAKLKDILCSYQNHITIIPINKYFKQIELEDNSFVITENCTTQSSIQICTCDTILFV